MRMGKGRGVERTGEEGGRQDKKIKSCIRGRTYEEGECCSTRYEIYGAEVEGYVLSSVQVHAKVNLGVKKGNGSTSLDFIC